MKGTLLMIMILPLLMMIMFLILRVRRVDTLLKVQDLDPVGIQIHSV